MIRIPILMYHSVDDSLAAACVHPEHFEQQLAYLKRVGYQAIDLDVVFSYMTEGGALPLKPVVITFDDGYRDNLKNAFPILKKYNMRATIFLATGYLGHSNGWCAADGVTQRPLMTWKEVNEAAKESLLSFQPHTCSHPKLTKIPVPQVREELVRSKLIIEDKLGRSCHHFAYPYGDFNEIVRSIVEEVGFRTACSVRWGRNQRGDDLFALYRIGIRNQDKLSNFKRAMGEKPSPLKYYWQRIKSVMQS